MAIFRVFIVTLALVVATVPAAMAQSFTVTVSGTTYNVVGLGIGNSFDDNATAIMDAPWWGDQSLAFFISTAVRAESGPTSYVAHYAYEFGTSGTGFYDAQIYTSSTASFAPDSSASSTNIPTSTTSQFGDPIQLFTGSIVPVPELDAPAFLQALFILLAFGLWLRTRSRIA